MKKGKKPMLKIEYVMICLIVPFRTIMSCDMDMVLSCRYEYSGSTEI